MQSVSFRIWTRVAVSISCDDNHYTTGTLLIMEVLRNEGNSFLQIKMYKCAVSDSKNGIPARTLTHRVFHTQDLLSRPALAILFVSTVMFKLEGYHRLRTCSSPSHRKLHVSSVPQIECHIYFDNNIEMVLESSFFSALLTSIHWIACRIALTRKARFMHPDK